MGLESKGNLQKMELRHRPLKVTLVEFDIKHHVVCDKLSCVYIVSFKFLAKDSDPSEITKTFEN